jgi:hypothetical protein
MIAQAGYWMMFADALLIVGAVVCSLIAALVVVAAFGTEDDDAIGKGLMTAALWLVLAAAAIAGVASVNGL